MRNVLINVIMYRLGLGQSKEDIISGIFHTVCDTLGVKHSDAQVIIRNAEHDKLVSDIVLDGIRDEERVERLRDGKVVNRSSVKLTQSYLDTFNG